jgi:pimeloyl-ACP methyl ester carboxylesterase
MLWMTALGLAALYGAYAVVVGVLAPRAMFPGPVELPAPTPPAHPRLERWAIAIDDGQVEAFFFAAPHASAGPAVVFAHGNGESIDGWVGRLDFYLEHGVSVLLIEYRGYGRSAGTASATAIVDDAERFLDMLARRPEVDPAQIIFHGRSIGSGVLCALAKRRPPQALVLESAFTSLDGFVRALLLPPLVLGAGRFDNLGAVRALADRRLPMLIMHGDHDEIFPLPMAHQLAAAGGAQATLKVHPCGHNNCDRDLVRRDIDAFLNQLSRRPEHHVR